MLKLKQFVVLHNDGNTKKEINIVNHIPYNFKVTATNVYTSGSMNE